MKRMRLVGGLAALAALLMLVAAPVSQARTTLAPADPEAATIARSCLLHGATQQQRLSTPVPLCALEPGDLVFSGNASFSYHVATYVGGGRVIHAPHTGAVVSYGSLQGAWTAGRLLPAS
jgi:cell wall-associated NlpC family hydrolase